MAQTHGNEHETYSESTSLSKEQVRWASLMGLIFVGCLVFDWMGYVPRYIPAILIHYLIPIGTLFPLLLGIWGVSGHRKIRSASERTATTWFGVYVIWFFAAVLLEVAWSGPYAVAISRQFRAYVSFAQTAVWALAGYRFVQGREDAAWLLRRFAVGAACICVVPFVLIVTGQAELEATPEMATIAERLGRVPNWGVEGFLLFGYCWFLTRTLLGGRLLSWSTAGLLACCELWAHLVKCTIFTIIPVTLAIIGLLLHRTGKMSRGLLYVGVVFGLLSGGVLIANMRSNGDFVDRVADYIAIRFLHVESLQKIGPTLSETVVVASSSRLGYIWPEALERFAASPVVGCGFNQEFLEPGGTYIPIHSAYLDLLVGVGVFGTLPVVLAFLRWSGTVWKAARLPENIPILVPCLGYTLCFLLDNFGDLLRYFHTPMMFFGLMLGISIKVALLPPEHVGSSRNRKVANLPPPAD